ncbi:MAG: hypothetical protein JW746_06755 [Candidatus Krumholzibacteriota bacterium]|nr:hypothetical protein [Candidatus Krumholzibacteriota bacterium]
MKSKNAQTKKVAGWPAKTALFLVVILTAITLAREAVSQVFGEYTTATIASEGEGGIFTSFGKDQFGTGVMARFLINRKSDLGIKTGFDRLGGLNSIGIGSDLKYYLLGEGSSMPVDMALDISLAHFRSENISRTSAGLALFVSGTLIADTTIPVEPYGSLGIYTSFLHNGDPCAGLDPTCNDDDNDTEMIFHGGTRIMVSDEYQVLLEIRVDGRTTFGAAINIIF